jgi:hypothetical protein
MRITPQAVTAVRNCAICERTLLVGERSVRYSPDGESFVDVCPLCQDVALEHGWVKEGSPTTPVVNDRRRKRKLGYPACRHYLLAGAAFEAGAAG